MHCQDGIIIGREHLMEASYKLESRKATEMNGWDGDIVKRRILRLYSKQFAIKEL